MIFIRKKKLFLAIGSVIIIGLLILVWNWLGKSKKDEIDEGIVSQASEILIEYGVEDMEIGYPAFPQLVQELYQDGKLNNYGGIYIGESGYCNPNLPSFTIVVKNMEISNIYLLEQLDYEGEVIIVSGDFSMRELEEVKDYIVQHTSDFNNVVSVGISDKMNRVYVGVTEVSDEMEEYIDSRENSEIIVIEIVEDLEQLD